MLTGIPAAADFLSRLVWNRKIHTPQVSCKAHSNSLLEMSLSFLIDAITILCKFLTSSLALSHPRSPEEEVRSYPCCTINPYTEKIYQKEKKTEHGYELINSSIVKLTVFATLLISRCRMITSHLAGCLLMC